MHRIKQDTASFSKTDPEWMRTLLQCKALAALFVWILMPACSVQSSSEKAAKDLFQMYEAVKDEDDTSKQAK